MVNSINNLLSLLTIGSQIFAALLVITFLAVPQRIKKIREVFFQYAFNLAFIVALIATLGSLFYSEIAKYEPCKLCWFERIFMYPQVILFGIAIWKKHTEIWIYTLTLSIIGLLITIYHYILQLGVTIPLPCSVVGYAASCSKKFFLQYGYITIPMMALTAFLLIILLMLWRKMYRK